MSKINLYKDQWAVKLKWFVSIVTQINELFANELPPFHIGKFMHAHDDASFLRHCEGIVLHSFPEGLPEP